MATDVPMPKLGLTMEEAMIVEWLVADGVDVAADTPIALIETDKTETEVGSPGAGRLHHIGRPGDVFACGVTIALLLADGEAPPSGPASAAPPAGVAAPVSAQSASAPAHVAAPPLPATDGRLLASPNARRVAAERGVSLASVRGTGPGGRIVSEDVASAPAPGVPPAPAQLPSAGSAVATAAARQLADLLGVDLAQVPADPVERRITREGVALHVRGLLQRLAPAAPAAPAAPLLTPLLQEPSSVVRLSGMRGTIAKRMQASLREMAQLTLTMDAAMDAVLADRSARKQAGGATPSITDYVVAATARALQRHPGINAQVTEAGIALLPEVHVGLAVAVDGGLLVPVIRDTAHRDLADLAAESKRLAEAARAGQLGPGDLEGGTFSVSALGAYGVDAFTPVINPPNAGILGIGRLRDDVTLEAGQVTTVKRLTLSLTWDHRVLDGAPAAEFCKTIVELLATPETL
jgi:pyruvate dehydrogenase E2 component (dihydrolipoamide acetyltransferase)